MPVEATVLPDGNYYLPSTGEIIPADIATPSPDDRFHHCSYYPVANEFDPWVIQFGVVKLKRDASLLQCTLRSSS
jgi:hypothetical protein